MPPHFPLGKSSLMLTQLFPFGNYFTLTKTSQFPFTQLCNYFCTHSEPTSAHTESLLLHTLRAYFCTQWEPTSAHTESLLLHSESLLLHTLRAYFCTQWEPTSTQVRACVLCVWNTVTALFQCTAASHQLHTAKFYSTKPHQPHTAKSYSTKLHQQQASATYFPS